MRIRFAGFNHPRYMPPGQWDPVDNGNNDQQLRDWRTDKLKGCIVLHHWAAQNRKKRGGDGWQKRINA